MPDQVEQAKAPSRRWMWIAGGTAATAVALGAVVWATYPEPAFEMWGTVSLDRDGAFSMNPECGGRGGYDDINPGATVTVYDAESKVLATGKLDKGKFAGQKSDAPCVFTFAVPNVPGGHDFYQVQVSHRGKIPVPVERAKGLVVLTLG